MPEENKTNQILHQIKHPLDVRDLNLQELENLAEELRKEIINTVSKTGGHLAPSLGTVEITLGLLLNFNPEEDKIIWDVGHQAYAYKILTQGVEKFSTLRQLNGISGFPNPNESIYDHFGVGHSSTSISAALGLAVARDLRGDTNKVVSIIGDGSMTAGLAYEGLNQAGDMGRNMLVILNDNEMSISRNVGALSSFFSRKLTDQRFLHFKEDLKNWLRQVPKIGEELVHYARRSEESLKNIFSPGMLFEAFKFNYLGPVDGHNLRRINQMLGQVQGLEGPVLLHVLTTKGKGYTPAEKDPTSFHGVGCFEPDTGQRKKAKSTPDYSTIFGQTLCHLARQDPKIVAITAAMPEGTGLASFRQNFPERFFDVGICEQHAVTFAAGMATQGLKPVVSIYSTFLQRAYDQIVHDVCLQNLPVTFCLDRGGLVGEDGPTHHGAFDLSYLRHIPNMTIMAPKDEPELQRMLMTALNHPGPAAIRYPRGRGPGHSLASELQPLQIGQGEIIQKGSGILIIALGGLVYTALQAVQEIQEQGQPGPTVYNCRFIKPLPVQEIKSLLQEHTALLLLEENSLAGGFGSGILELLVDENLDRGLKIKRIGLPDRFIRHGERSQLLAALGLDTNGIKSALQELM